MSKGDYEIGYGKPPKHTRWRPGQSGNPRGKEKGHRGLRTDLEAELNTTATIAGKDGWKRKGRLQRLAVATLCLRAANGDLKAQAILFPMILNVLGVEDRRTGPRKLSTEDQALLDELLASLEGNEVVLYADGSGGPRHAPPPSIEPDATHENEEGGDGSAHR